MPFMLQWCNTLKICRLPGECSAFWDAARKKKVFAVWEALLKPVGSCGVREWAVGFEEQAVAN